ncbi:MAG: serine acetyltransferase [Bacteroidetes bacterium]|nr:serine acetyltransferase [Bacteroidota bacterium]
MNQLNRESDRKPAHQIFESNAAFSSLPFNLELLGRWADEIFLGLLQLIEQTQSSSVNSGECVESFFTRLPVVHRLLKSDLETMYNSDPAAKSVHEVLLAYPGFYAISIYRIAHELWLYKVTVIPRLLTEHAHFKTGIDIHPAAMIGERFLIDHGTGVVIGETCNIGTDVKIYQGVTLGALSVSRDHAATKRHPTIGDRVVVYANATILGGNTLIGPDSVIGGNVWITQSIPSNSLVFHKSEIVIKNNTNFPEPLNFII